MRYRVTLAYDGTNYAGWQMQAGQDTIQYRLEQALATLDKGRVVPMAAGRTDAGVHAEGQVVSFDLRHDRRVETLECALNDMLPPDIRVLGAEVVADTFHAGFDAIGKLYRYRLITTRVMSPFELRYGCHYRYRLDEARLEADAQSLVGVHDFSSFTTADCQAKTHIRRITSVKITRDGGVLTLWFAGQGFLRYQVRKMVAALLEFNRGRLSVDSIAELIARRDRGLIGTVAPPQGLTLMKVEY